MSSKPRNEPEATTYFQLQRNRDGLPEPGEEKPSGDVSSLPPQPSTSPWAADPVPAEEPIDRREDGDVFIQPTEGE
jgi:hypothetical protein